MQLGVLQFSYSVPLRCVLTMPRCVPQKHCYRMGASTRDRHMCCRRCGSHRLIATPHLGVALADFSRGRTCVIIPQGVVHIFPKCGVVRTCAIMQKYHTMGLLMRFSAAVMFFRSHSLRNTYISGHQTTSCLGAACRGGSGSFGRQCGCRCRRGIVALSSSIPCQSAQLRRAALWRRAGARNLLLERHARVQ